MAELDSRDAELLKQANNTQDERLLKLTLTKKDGKIGWVRDVDTMMVDSVEAGSAAEEAGVKPKMRILEVNDVIVANDTEFSKEMAKAGDTLTLVMDIEEMLEQVEKIVLDKSVIEAAHALSLEEQNKIDERIQEGVNLFMNNEYAKAEALYEEMSTKDPLASVAWATVGFLRAVMSFAPKDMKEARRRIARTQCIANQIAPPVNIASSIKSLWSGSKPVTNCYIRARVAATDANLLKSILLLTEDSIMSHVRAGIGLRRGYVDIEALSKQVDSTLKKSKIPSTSPKGLPPGKTATPAGPKLGQWGPEVYHFYEYNTIGGLQFGLGAINCSLSAMPARILALLSLFGFMCDRETGFDNLNKALEGGGCRSAVAGLFLTGFHGLLPSFASVLTKDAIPKADSLVETMLKQHGNSAIYLWVAGRVARLKRDVNAATANFQKAISLGRKEEFIQLTHVSYYELAWCHMYKLDFKAAIPFFELLLKESEWSKCFNCYAIATCHDEAGDKASAVKYYNQSLTYLGKKFGGRTISVEQFIERKVKMWTETNFEKTLHPGIELMMLFNAFSQMELEKLKEVENLASKAIETYKSTVDDEQISILELIRANTAKETGDEDVARAAYRDLTEKYPTKKWKKLLKTESWILPYAIFEYSCLHYTSGDFDAAVDLLGQAEKFKDFNFEMPLALRLHLAKELFLKAQPQKEKKKWGFFGR